MGRREPGVGGRPERAAGSPRGCAPRVARSPAWVGSTRGRTGAPRVSVPRVDGREPTRTVPPVRVPRVAPRPPRVGAAPTHPSAHGAAVAPRTLVGGGGGGDGREKPSELRPPTPPRTPLPTAPPRTAPPLRTPPRGRAVNGGGRSRVGAAVHVEVWYSGLGGSAEPSRFSQSGPGSPSPVPVQPLPSQFNQYGPSTPSAIPLLPLRSQFSQYRVPSTVPVVIVWSQFNPVPSQFNQ